jgi:hypothetical protein
MNESPKKSKQKESDEAIEIDEHGIEAKESKPEIEKKAAKPIKINGGSKWKRLINWYKTNKKKSIPLTIVLILILLVVVPWTRYQVAAMALKNTYNLNISDSTSGTPISGALVKIGDNTVTTDGSGKATLHNVPVGKHPLVITKKYYKNSTANVLVPISKQKSISTYKLVATGRQVKVSVKNLINHTALADVDISVSGVNAKTDKSGSATLVLLAGTKEAKAKLSLDGYNNADVNVLVDDKSIKENNFALTPSGKVYFLSKLSGKIDIVKTNLDGSSRQTVLAGTGKEDSSGTVLLASRDWKYLALLSNREGAKNPKLYLINTEDGSMTSMDSEATSSFNPVGWSDHNFIYTASRSDVENWQPDHQALKSYDAESKKVAVLDHTGGDHLGPLEGYKYESIGNVYQLGKTVVYDKFWNIYQMGNYVPVEDKAGIYSVSVAGGKPQMLKAFSYVLGQSTYITSIPYEANQIYYQTSDGGAPLAYYAYSNGKLSAKSDIANDFNKYYQQGASTYLQSPSGNETFWSESRDGKYSLFTGDDNGDNSKQIAVLSELQTYGWYTDDYLLASKNGSELYILPKSGLSKESQPIKITDYHKPARNFLGYGGGYGGI